jgi:hypothetical protein
VVWVQKRHSRDLLDVLDELAVVCDDDEPATESLSATKEQRDHFLEMQVCLTIDWLRPVVLP